MLRRLPCHPAIMLAGLLIVTLTLNGCGNTATDGTVSKTPTVPVESDHEPPATTLRQAP